MNVKFTRKIQILNIKSHKFYYTSILSMTKDDYDLDGIIKKSFEEAIEYFNKNGIKIEGLKLRIVKSPWSFYDIFILLFVDQGNLGIYFPSKKIFIIKKQLEKTANKILDELSNNNIKDSSIISIKLSKNSIISYPFYLDMKNIKNNIMKTVTDIIIAHEIGHAVIRSIGSKGEWKASAFEYLVYFYKNEFYNYPEVYKIIEENIKVCKTYIEENKKLNIYELGRCYGNIIIHKNKQSTNINIKDIIEEIKNLSEKDIINTIKNHIIK